MTRGEVTTLLDLCMDTSLGFLESASFKNQHIFLPEDLCEAFISKRLKCGDCNDNFLATFSDPQTSRIVRLNLKGASITDRGLELISCQPLKELNISSCRLVTQDGLKYLHRCKNTLMCLNLGQCCRIYDFTEVASFYNLKVLDLRNTVITQEQFERISLGLQNLMSLNLTETYISDLSPVNFMRSLTTLDLSECPDIQSIKPLECLKGWVMWNIPKQDKTAQILTIFVDKCITLHFRLWINEESHTIFLDNIDLKPALWINISFVLL